MGGSGRLALIAVAALVVVAGGIALWIHLFPVTPIQSSATNGSTATVAGPGTPPGPGMADYIQGLGYQPLPIPRDRWGPGTVLTFDDKGEERIIWFNEQCLKLAAPPFDSDPPGTAEVEVAASALPTFTLDQGRDAAAQVRLDKALGAQVDLDAAFADKRVRQVKIAVSKARQFVAPIGSVRERVKRAASRSLACVDDLHRPRNFIVYAALVFSDASFQFIGADETSLKLDAKLLGAIQAGPDLSAKMNGATALPINQPRIVGYKLLAVEDVEHGAAGSGFTLRPLSAADIARLKAPQPSR
jgi:hypothetical protein